jgi:hypothetical protein
MAKISIDAIEGQTLVGLYQKWQLSLGIEFVRLCLQKEKAIRVSAKEIVVGNNEHYSLCHQDDLDDSHDNGYVSVGKKLRLLIFIVEQSGLKILKLHLN